MLSFDDNRWATLEAANGRLQDMRPLLRDLESAADPSVAWDALWTHLHHQGDIGVASFVVVPHLVSIHRARGVMEWNTYALVATIELARGRGRNPDVPEWARLDYEAALRELGEVGRAELPLATSSEAVRSVLAVLAITCGARVYGRVLAELTEDEVAELLGDVV